MNAIEHGTARRLAITATVLVLSVWVMQREITPATRYVMVDELVAGGLEHHEGQPFQVHGYVRPGSITGDDRGRGFVLTKGGRDLRVFVTGPVPDGFRDQAEVVVSGELVARGGVPVLVGDRLLMKCAIKYDGDPAARRALRFE